MVDKKNVKKYAKPVILGSGVVLLTPLISAYIPEIYALGSFITVGAAVSAGIAAFAIDMLLEKFM